MCVPGLTKLMRFDRIVLGLFAAALLGGCNIVPKDGPTNFNLQSSPDVSLQRTASTVGYALINLSPPIIETANSAVGSRIPSFDQLPRVRNAPDVRIGTGDLVNLTIFESQAGGLFIPQEAGSRAGNFVSVPNQQVDATGSITVPYAGTIKAVGRTANEVSEEITKKLANRAIEPQVVVTIAERRGNEISVLGDVNTPLRFAVDPGGIKLLGAISRAAGPKDAPYETVVSVQRGRRIAQMSMSALLKNPGENVDLAPGDVVYLSKQQKVFMTFGATPSPGSVGGINDRRFSFDDDNMSLSEAVAKSGGLDPTRADATAVFVFRFEPRQKLADMGINVSNYHTTSVPTVYVADWSKSDAFFLSNNFFIRDKDVIFVSEHPTTDFLKLANVVRAVTGGASEVGTTAAVAIR